MEQLINMPVDTLKDWIHKTPSKSLRAEMQEFLERNTPEAIPQDEPVKYVGLLTKSFGIVGYETAENDHPVFEHKDKYLIYLKHQKTAEVKTVCFYKDTLKPYISFL